MPPKFHIRVESAPPRIPPIGKFGIVDWREDCSSCHNCVKRACIYGLYRDESDRLREEVGFLDYIYHCKGCLSCVQDCTKNILTRVVNPEYERLGDATYTPDIILATWYQAETGQIPISGAGYGGPFSGSGFDSMWTDMSEIVRPTRDGIHGREYINTSVDIGRKSKHLEFTRGELVTTPAPIVEIPLPVIFEAIPEHWRRGPVLPAIIKAAAKLGLMSVVEADGNLMRFSAAENRIIPSLGIAETTSNGVPSAAEMILVPDQPEVETVRADLKRRNPEPIVAVRVQASPDAVDRVRELTRDGVEVVHLVFDRSGHEKAPSKPRHARDVLREIHGALVEDGTRDQMTLVASGGIALAEHVIKAVICGADLVAIDVPLLLAMECRLCGECLRGEVCPIALSEIEQSYAERRILNLMGAWHQQLIELLGAMGIREMRRVRGEIGRAMFFEDLERESFGELFGTPRKASSLP